jgi:uncharacterized protein YbdZ (MbtH family)
MKRRGNEEKSSKKDTEYIECEWEKMKPMKSEEHNSPNSHNGRGK